MSPDELARALIAEMRQRYPSEDAREVVAHATAFLVEAITFVVDRATSDEESRRSSLHMIASAFDDAATQARRAFPYD